MQLLVYIMKKTERLPQVLAGFMREGISGTTVLDSQGALPLIHQKGVDDPPAFGALRRFLNPHGSPEKMILVVLEDELCEKAFRVIRETVDIDQPDTGIFFTLPVSHVEGLSK